MKTGRNRMLGGWLCVIALVLGAVSSQAHAQERAVSKKPHQSVSAAQQGSTSQLPVVGNGTAGQLTKWVGFGNTSNAIGDSLITETKQGNIGIGIALPNSKLTVQGMIETTLGGYKFPDGSVQTTAAVSFVTHDASLAGLGTEVSPLGIAAGGVNTVHLANGAVTAPKIANGTVVRSFNGLFDNISLVAGNN